MHKHFIGFISFAFLITSCLNQKQAEIEELDFSGKGKSQNLDLNAGINLYQNNCASCHGQIEESAKKNRGAASIRISLSNVQAMAFLDGKFSDEEINAMALALSADYSNEGDSGNNNGNGADTGTGGSDGENLVGSAAGGSVIFRQRNCTSCHTGSLYDQIRGKSVQDFNNAIVDSSTGMGAYFSMSAQQKADLIAYLAVLPEGGGQPSDKQSVFRDSVYQITSSNSCVGCHSSGFVAHGSANLSEAYNSSLNLVNFQDMPSSKMVRTMKGENPAVSGHQVFSDELVIQMQAAINKWKEAEAPDGTEIYTDEVKAFRDSVYVVTRSNCLGCHRNGGRSRHASNDLIEAYNEAKNNVNFNNINGSDLVTKAQNHGGGSYPVAAAELRIAIQYWKTFEDQAGGN